MSDDLRARVDTLSKEVAALHEVFSVVRGVIADVSSTMKAVTDSSNSMEERMRKMELSVAHFSQCADALLRANEEINRQLAFLAGNEEQEKPRH